MGKVTILNETIKYPLSFMGSVAGIAYNSDISIQEKNQKRGLNCVRAGHGRMWEFCDIFMKIEGYSVRVMREFMRHVGDGLTAIQRSTRYVNESDFGYYIPKYFYKENNEVDFDAYTDIMSDISITYEEMLQRGVPKEDAANILPLGLDTVVVVKHNARTMIQMAEVRLCNRAYEEYRQLMKDIIIALGEYSEEWSLVVQEFFKCKCDKLEYCEEEYCCGKYKKKDEMILVSKEEYLKLLHNQHTKSQIDFKKYNKYDNTIKYKYSNETSK